MNDALFWRTRREGDRILARGMHRSVRRLMREAGLTLEERQALPILCMGEEILWVPYVAMRDGVGTTDPSCDGVLVQIYRNEQT